MEIISVNNDNYNIVLNFLVSIASIKDIDEEVVKKASIIKNNDDIIGVLSYEKFGFVALIRYFVFKKVVSEEIINDLLDEIIKKAKREDIKTLVTLVVKQEIIDVFRNLGFRVIEKQSIFLDEVCLLDTKFKDSIVLKYDI